MTPPGLRLTEGHRGDRERRCASARPACGTASECRKREPGGDAAETKVKQYVAAYDQTKFAFSGGTDVTALGFYTRLDGSVAWIELSTESGIVLQGTHRHSIDREQGADYDGS